MVARHDWRRHGWVIRSGRQPLAKPSAQAKTSLEAVAHHVRTAHVAADMSRETRRRAHPARPGRHPCRRAARPRAANTGATRLPRPPRRLVRRAAAAGVSCTSPRLVASLPPLDAISRRSAKSVGGERSHDKKEEGKICGARGFAAPTRRPEAINGAAAPHGRMIGVVSFVSSVEPARRT